jgi:integrase
VQRRLDARTRKWKQTKSATSVRRIDLDTATIAHLEAHRKRMEVENLAVGPSELVFPNEVGKALSASNLLKRDFHPLVADAGLPEELRFHDLRHSHATLLLSRGVTPKVVQERLGHESVKTTLDVYGHVLPIAQRDAAALVGSVLFDPKSLTLCLTNRSKKRPQRASPKEETLAA